MNKLKVSVINPASDSVKVGNDIITLEDFTDETFQTNSLDDFCSYLENIDPDGSLNNIYLNEKFVTAFPVEIDHFSGITCSCKMENHRALSMLLQKENSVMNRQEFENFLRYLARYGDENVLDLFSWVKNFEIKTVNHIQRRKEPDGSFSLHISREKAEKESYSPPTKISFHVPIFKNMLNNVLLDFEFFFDYTNHEDKVTTSFKILNVEINEIIEKAQKEVISDFTKGLKNKKYWGSLSINQKNDSWKYRENKLD